MIEETHNQNAIQNIHPRFSRGELWLLNAVIEFSLEICTLKTEQASALINKPHHELSLDDISKALLNLYDMGLVSVCRADNNQNDFIELSSEKLADIFDTEVRSLQEETNNHVYQLTEKGGLYWEAFTRPHWKNYVYEESECINWEACESDENIPAIWRAEIACLDKRLLHEFLNKFSYGDIDKATVQFTQVAKYEMTYWKTLTNVHVLNFEYNEKESREIGFERTLYNKLWCNWY